MARSNRSALRQIIHPIRSAALITATACLFTTSLAHAGGFYLSEVGSPGSLGTAGVANSTNNWGADTAWTNPAGMTGVDTSTIMGGTTLLLPRTEFEPTAAEAGGDDGGNAGAQAVIPSLFYVHKLNEKARFGLGLTAPLGGGLDFGENFVGRYGVIKNALQGVGVTTSFGYKVNDRLSLGLGASIVYTIFDQDIAVNQGPLPDGKVEFDDLDDIGVQGILGLQYAITDRTMLGVVYRSEFDAELDGDLNINIVIPANFADSIEIDWTNPQWLEVGLRHQLAEDSYLFFSANWQEWSEFSSNQLAISGGPMGPTSAVLDRNWDDTWGVGIGWIRRMGSRVITMGASYDSSVVEDEFRTIDLPIDEQWKFSFAIGREGTGRLDHSIGATVMFMGKNNIDQTAQGSRFAGEFDTNFLVFLGFSIRHQFGAGN